MKKFYKVFFLIIFFLTSLNATKPVTIVPHQLFVAQNKVEVSIKGKKTKPSLTPLYNLQEKNIISKITSQLLATQVFAPFANYIMTKTSNIFNINQDIQDILTKSLATGIAFQSKGKDFKDGFKKALILSSIAFTYNKISNKYNTNSGRSHIFQKGVSNVGREGLKKLSNGKFPWTSDKSSFMKGVGKYLPFGDAFAEFHDGLLDKFTWLEKPILNELSMLVSYPVAVLADRIIAQLIMSDDAKKE